MTDVTINTGTIVSMSATLPTTYDGNVTTGYPAATYTAIGEVVDVGEIAKAWAAITHQSVTRAYPQKLKDTYDIGNVSMTLGRVNNDVGQVLLATALASSASYSFKVALPGGDIAYFTGKVLKSGLGAIASGAVSSTVVDIAVDPETLYEV